MSFDRLHAPLNSTSSEPSPLVEARFIPRQYEPNYPYPLLVHFHARCGDEEQLVRAMPALSWRNYIGLGLRGPEPVIKRDRLVGYGWGAEFEQPARRRMRSGSPVSEAESVRRAFFGAERDPIERLEEAVFESILQTRRLLHTHSERIFLVGSGEGAAVAYWLGLSFPERFAGIVAINGWLPVGLRPLGRLKACRDLPVLVVHGAWNARVPLSDARQNVATLRAGGLRVAFQSYPSAHRLSNPMLSDVDTWLMGHCTAGPSV
jgi:phospholipase/carboxylesterase